MASSIIYIMYTWIKGLCIWTCPNLPVAHLQSSFTHEPLSSSFSPLIFSKSLPLAWAKWRQQVNATSSLPEHSWIMTTSTPTYKQTGQHMDYFSLVLILHAIMSRTQPAQYAYSIPLVHSTPFIKKKKTKTFIKSKNKNPSLYDGSLKSKIW